MTASTDTAHPKVAQNEQQDHHGHDVRHVHSHDHGDGGAAHGSFKGYLTGFLLSVVLTAIPFWLVMAKVFEDKQVTIVIILAFAVVQILVHMIYFLHMNTSSENGWNMLALIFTLVLVVIALSGSMWVTYNLNANMMPKTAHEMREMP